jgi:hypothetical protein
MANSLSFAFNLGIVAVQGKCSFTAIALQWSRSEAFQPIMVVPSQALIAAVRGSGYGP